MKKEDRFGTRDRSFLVLILPFGENGQCGAFIKWDKYGDRSDRYNNGWEIDHIKPDSLGGADVISNARPLQWYNNASRQNGKLTCPITAEEE